MARMVVRKMNPKLDSGRVKGKQGVGANSECFRQSKVQSAVAAKIWPLVLSPWLVERLQELAKEGEI